MKSKIQNSTHFESTPSVRSAVEGTADCSNIDSDSFLVPRKVMLLPHMLQPIGKDLGSSWRLNSCVEELLYPVGTCVPSPLFFLSLNNITGILSN